MGLNLHEISRGAQGLKEGLQEGAINQRAAAEERRRQTAADRETAGYNANQALNEWLAKRGEIDMPDPVQPIPQAQALPTGAPGAEIAPAPEGTASASPTDPGGALPLSTMEVPGERRDRRQRYEAWRTKGEELAALAGGLEGLQAFQQREDFLNQQQMYHFAREAEIAMQDNNAGAAAKALNSAMEVSPVDMGIEWYTVNGELYADRGGQEDGPYNQEAVLGLMEKYLATTENYQDFQKQALAERKQDEVERAAQVSEGQQGERIDLLEREVATREGALPSQNLERNARAYSLLTTADAAARRAELAGQAKDMGWSEANLLKIDNDVSKLVLEGQLGFGTEWSDAIDSNPALANAITGSIKDIRMSNPPDSMSYNDAAAISQGAYSLMAGLPVPENVRNMQVGQQGNNFFVRYGGKSLAVPPEVAESIRSAQTTFK